MCLCMFLFLFSAEGRVSKQLSFIPNKPDPDNSKGLEEEKHNRRWVGEKNPAACPFLLL